MANALGVDFEWLLHGDIEESKAGVNEFAKENLRDDEYLIKFEDAGMREKLKALADASGRGTINNEINAALLAHIANEGGSPSQVISLPDSDLDKLANKVALKLKRLVK